MRLKLILLLSLMCTQQLSHAQTKAVIRKTLTGHSVTLSCTPAGTVTGFNFYRGTVSGQESTTPLNATPTSACSYVDTAVNPLTTYFYTAKAFCSTCSPNLSLPSNEVTAVIPADAQPAAPVLNAPVVAGNKIQLKWKTPVQPGITINSYNLFRCINPSCPAPPKIATVGALSYTDTVALHKTYYYEVNANDTVNNRKVISPMSNIVTAKN